MARSAGCTWRIGVVAMVAGVVGLALASGVGAAGTDVPHLQFRAVLAELPPANAPGPPDPASGATIASCDTNAVVALGSSVATTKANRAQPGECVVLANRDGSGRRYFLGPSALDATGVEKAASRFDSGSGWSLQLTLTARGAEAFDALAAQQFHHNVALVSDARVVVTPMIQPANATFEPFDGNVVTSGFKPREAKGLARSIARWKTSG
jgi:preprotein translocase subunit SecD